MKTWAVVAALVALILLTLYATPTPELEDSDIPEVREQVELQKTKFSLFRNYREAERLLAESKDSSKHKTEGSTGQEEKFSGDVWRILIYNDRMDTLAQFYPVKGHLFLIDRRTFEADKWRIIVPEHCLGVAQKLH